MPASARGRRNLCFAGHVDVVPPGDAELWTHPPFAAEIDGGALYGRGASDMKGAIACFTAAALDYVKSRGREIDGSISLLITGDEEGPAVNGTRKVLAWMKEQGERPDHCMVGEPSNVKRIGETIKIGTARQPERQAEGDRYARPRRLSASRRQSRQGPGEDTRAPLRFAARLRQRTFLAVQSRSDDHRCRQSHDQHHPRFAEARFNVRFNDRHEADALKALLRDHASAALAGSDLSFNIEFEPPAESFLTEPGPLDALLSEAVRDVTGLTPSLSTDGGTSDAAVHQGRIAR